MDLPILKVVTNYDQMLSKISISTFFVFWFSTNLIFFNPTDFDTLKLNFQLETSSYLMIFSIIIAVIARMIKFHDLLSNLFKIRLKYDVQYIIKPLIDSIRPDKIIDMDSLISNRNQIMYSCFYKYASSKDENSIVSKHLITQVLESWSWFWMILEALPIMIVSTFYFGIIKNIVLLAGYLIFTLVFFSLSFYIYKQCKRYTKLEIDVILSNAGAVENIGKDLDAIFNW